MSLDDSFSPRTYKVIALFYTWANGGLEKSITLPEIMQLVSVEAVELGSQTSEAKLLNTMFYPYSG
jgi:hypothetical protein